MTRVAIVTSDPSIRDSAARAFESSPSTWSVSLEDSRPHDADVIVWGPDTYPGTGILFDPTDPEKVVSSARAEASPTRVIWVASAGGGQGVTTVAAHLAASAASDDRTSCLVDAEPGSATRYRIGVPFDEAKSWADADEDLLLAAIPTQHGFRVLLAPPSTNEKLEPVVARSELVFDRVIVDGGRSAPCVDSGARVLVMSPTIPAANRARRMLWADDRGWIVVTNRLGRGGEATRSELERVLEMPISFELPHCPALRDAEDEGGLILHSWTRWWWTFRALATEVGL